MRLYGRFGYCAPQRAQIAPRLTRPGVIPAGTVAGMRHRWEAIVDGRPVIVFQSNWKMADDLTPDICEGTNRYIVEFHGEPSTKGRHSRGRILPMRPVRGRS